MIGTCAFNAMKVKPFFQLGLDLRVPSGVMAK